PSFFIYHAPSPTEIYTLSLHDALPIYNLFALSRQLRDSTRLDLLIWPEAAVPEYFVNRPEWDTAIAQRVRATGTPLVAGGLDAVIHPDQSYDYYNAAFFYDSTGDRSAYPVYRKHYLVPIVERVP